MTEIRVTLRHMRDSGLGLLAPRRLAELSGERVVFKYLRRNAYLDDLGGKRILEIGPKHGQDSLLLATLNPGELVLIDLPEKDSMVREWLPRVRGNPTYIEGNVLYLTQEETEQLGAFDLVWCLGILYHNAEQLRLVKRLWDLCAINGRVVVESATTRNRKLRGLSAVEIHWPKTYRTVPTITHLPTRLAIKSWMEMVGFEGVEILDVYSRGLGRDRAVLFGVKTGNSKPWISYAASGLNPVYEIGNSP